MYGQLVNTSMTADDVKSGGSGGHKKYWEGDLHTPDNKVFLINENNLIELINMKEWEKDRLLELKAQGWQSTIRQPQIDKATGRPKDSAEYDHLVFSFSAEETRALKENPDLVQVYKTAFAEAATTSCNSQPGKKMAFILDPHDDTANLHFHAYVHRHPVDVDAKTIGRSEELHKASVQAAFLQHLNNVMEKHGLQKASDLRDMTGRGLFVDRAPAKAEAQTAVAEAIHEAGGVAVMRADARSFSEMTPEIDKISQFEAQRRQQAERLQAEITRLERDMQAATNDVLLAQNAMAALERDAVQQAKIIELENEKDNIEENLNTLTDDYTNLVNEKDIAEKQNADYSAKNTELSNEVNTLKEDNEKMKVEHEEKITDLTDNHESLVEKLKEDNDKAVKSYKSDIEVIKANNLLLTESLAALRENNDLLKKSLHYTEKDNEKLEKDIEEIKDFNYKLDTENDKLRKNNSEIGKDNEWMDKRIKELQKQNEEYDLIIKNQTNEINKKIADFDEYMRKSKTNDYVIRANDNVKSNDDYKKSFEYQKLMYAGVTDSDNKLGYPPGFNQMSKDNQKLIARDIFVASTIRWGDDWIINCEDKKLKSFLENLREENKDYIKQKVDAFNNENKPKAETKTDNKEEDKKDNKPDNKPDDKPDDKPEKEKKSESELFDEHYKNVLKSGVLNDIEFAKELAKDDELMQKVIERFENEQNQNNESDIKGLGEK